MKRFKLLFLSLLVILFPVLVTGYSILTGDLSGMVLTEGTYYLDNVCTVSDTGILTVNANAVLKFAPSGGIRVFGRIDVNGTETGHVYFTSVNDNSVGETISLSTGNPQAGDWKGVECYSFNDSPSIGEFDYSTLRYGGRIGNGNLYYRDSDLGYFNNSTSEFGSSYGLESYASNLTVSNSSFTNNEDSGIYAQGSIDIDNCSFNNNDGYAAYLYSTEVTSYSSNSGSGNLINAFGINGNIEENLTLGANEIGFPIVLTGTLTVDETSILTIPENNVIKATSSGKISVRGTIDVNGTESSPVYFTSINDDTIGQVYGISSGNPQAGDWKGIECYSYNDSPSIGEFDYCTLRYGGRIGNGNLYYRDSNSGYFNNSSSEFSSSYGLESYASNLTVSNSSFTNNEDSGIYAQGSIDIDNCNITDNNGYAAYLFNTEVSSYLSNSGSGNLINAFGINGNINEDITLGEEEVGFPIVLTGTLTVDDTSTLTIPENNVIKATSSGKISVRGTIDVNGTETSPVYFTSINDDSIGQVYGNSTGIPQAGDWNGIECYSYNDSPSIGEFDYCSLRYGGRNGNGNLHYSNSISGYFNNSSSEFSSSYGLESYSSNLTVSNSSFTNNEDSGIYGNATIDIDNCNFTDNNAYAAYLFNAEVSNYSGNSGSGNLINAFGINGNINEDITLGEEEVGFPLILTGTLIVNDSATLTIPQNNIIKATLTGAISVRGTIDVNGTESNPVCFTSINDDTIGQVYGISTGIPQAGDWKGIECYSFNDSPSIGEFDYSTLRYGGRNGNGNLYYRNTQGGYFHNSVSELSSSYGIYTNSDISVYNSIIENNLSYGVFVFGGNPDFGSSSSNPGLNTIINNDSNEYQFYNTSSNNINAYYNTWGYENVNAIDQHIFDDNESSSSGEVLFDPWFVEIAEISLLTPTSQDFGSIFYGLSSTKSIVIKNVGTIDLVINDIYISPEFPDVFDLSYNIDNPIQPNEQDTILVTFSPGSNINYQSSLLIDNNSSNQPLLEIFLQGTGEYDQIPNPQNVNFSLSNGNANITWDPVIETEHGIPVTPDFYVINYSDDPSASPDEFLHLAITDQLTYSHSGVVWFADQMFYSVIAIRDYEGQYSARMRNQSSINKSLTWKEIKAKYNID